MPQPTMPQPTMPQPTKTVRRRVPTQKRSKALYDGVLNAAESHLIVKGVGSLTMLEIARKADVPIGSLYQYFSNIEDVLVALASRYYSAIETNVEDHFAGVSCLSEFSARLLIVLREAFDFLEQSLGFRELWFGAQAWGNFRKLDWADTRKNAEVMARTLQPILPNIAYRELEAAGIIICDSAGSVARMAIEFPEMRENLLSQYERMVVDHLAAMQSRCLFELPRQSES
ncbi:MAG: TetR/AcrR family transcriptional regulator, partial [Sphingopyxis sp.]